MPWETILFLLAIPTLFGLTYMLKPIALGRGLRSAFLICVSAFCVFGFLASFESPEFLFFKVVYPIIGCASLAGAILPWTIRSSKQTDIAT